MNKILLNRIRNFFKERGDACFTKAKVHQSLNREWYIISDAIDQLKKNKELKMSQHPCTHWKCYKSTKKLFDVLNNES